MIPPSCRVVRDATITSIPASELVKGDVVLVVSVVHALNETDDLTVPLARR